MKRSELVARALLLADERNESSSQPTVVDSIAERIDALLEEALGWVALIAPPHLLPLKSLTESAVGNLDGSGYIPLPDDFMRLASLRMEGWSYDVTELHEEHSPIALQQRNSSTRATHQRPICVVALSPLGKRAIYYYSVPLFLQHNIVHGYYLPLIKLTEEDSELTLHPLLVDAVAYRAVALLYNSVERADLGTLCTNAAIEKLQLVAQSK